MAPPSRAAAITVEAAHLSLQRQHRVTGQLREPGTDQGDGTKVHLEPGKSRSVTITVDPAATNHPFGVWDDAAHAFVVVPEEYTVYVGTSAEETPFASQVQVA